MTTQAMPTGPEWFGHPRGLFVCFATEMWERFSFYGMKYLLVLFLVQHHLFSDGEALRILGAYAALVYAMHCWAVCRTVTLVKKRSSWVESCSF